MRSVAGQSAFGPVAPNGVIDTVTSAGFGGAQGGEVDGHGAALDHGVGAGAQLGAARPARRPWSRSSTTLRLPRFHPQNVSECSPSSTSPANGPRGATGRPFGRLDEDDVGAEAGEDERGQVAALVGQVDDPVRTRASVATPIGISWWRRW